CPFVPPELPQQHVCKEEEVLTDQQLCDQERNSSLDQEDPEPPQIKEEEEELCTSEKSIKCDTCGKDFKYKSKLKIHQRRHTRERPYCCSTCGKKFTQTSSLKNHLRIHTDEKPYSCSTCGKKFRWPSILKNHLRIHTGEKPYFCETCAKRFTFLLSEHTKTHTGHQSHTSLSV
uniref:C2H2-type domain-containing protein n=1 Tax=Seriola dumerili TaxID=41447 RepID=A0A3B4TMF9_SERDU